MNKGKEYKIKEADAINVLNLVKKAVFNVEAEAVHYVLEILSKLQPIEAEEETKKKKQKRKKINKVNHGIL